MVPAWLAWDAGTAQILNNHAQAHGDRVSHFGGAFLAEGARVCYLDGKNIDLVGQI